MLVGLPGAGKSTFYQAALRRHPPADQQGSVRRTTGSRRAGRRELIAQALAEGQSVVVDNTNPTRAERAAIVQQARAHGARATVYYFDCTTRECLARNATRQGRAARAQCGHLRHRPPPAAARRRRGLRPGLRRPTDRRRRLRGPPAARRPGSDRAAETQLPRGPDGTASAPSTHVDLWTQGLFMRATSSICLRRWLGVGVLVLRAPARRGPLGGPRWWRLRTHRSTTAAPTRTCPSSSRSPTPARATTGPGSEGGTAPDACTPLTCSVAGGRFCGRIGDGCGNALECGDCPDGQLCGGAGMAHVCSPPPGTACTPITCDQATGRLCGRIGDGCGRLLDCGDCAGGMACGAGGTANVCAARPAPAPRSPAPRPAAATAARSATAAAGCSTAATARPARPAAATARQGVCGTGLGQLHRPHLQRRPAAASAATSATAAATRSTAAPAPPARPAAATARPTSAPACWAAARRSTCDQPNGRYCGMVGDGCGGRSTAAPAPPARSAAPVPGVCAPDPGSARR